MYYQNESFGMMDEGYFVPRSDILNWINNLLHINITKIESLGSGNIYCQILDVIYPGKVPLSKVNWKAKLDYEFINNLKILQASFDKLGIKKNIEIEKLSKAKYQDNLQLIQWLKRYYDLNCGGRGDNYQAQQRRGFIKPDFSFAEKGTNPKDQGNISKLSSVSSHPTIRPKKMTSPNLHTHQQNAQQKVCSSKQIFGRSSKKIADVVHQQQQQLLSKQYRLKSPDEEKLELIGDILAKKDLSYQQKIKLIEQVMSL